MMLSKPKYSHSIPFLACNDVMETVKFYCDVLGFNLEWKWGDPPGDAGVRRDDLRVYITRNPDLAARVRGQEVVLMVKGVDAACEEHRSRGASIVQEPEDKPWGTREYQINDPAGYCLRFTEACED
jgi:uncharacterized glyoxalase superfamily protein PhnB